MFTKEEIELYKKQMELKELLKKLLALKKFLAR